MLGQRSVSWCGRIVIADDDPITRASLKLLASSMPDLDCVFCTSPSQASQQCLRSYHVIVSSVRFARKHNFAMLNRHRTRDQSIPFVVIASGRDKAVATQSLDRGAFDVIGKPFDSLQAEATLRLALASSRLHRLISLKENTLQRYRWALGSYEYNERLEVFFKRHRSVMNTTLQTVETTIQRIEESILSYKEVAREVHDLSRKQSLEHLEGLREN